MNKNYLHNFVFMGLVVVSIIASATDWRQGGSNSLFQENRLEGLKQELVDKKKILERLGNEIAEMVSDIDEASRAFDEQWAKFLGINLDMDMSLDTHQINPVKDISENVKEVLSNNITTELGISPSRLSISDQSACKGSIRNLLNVFFENANVTIVPKKPGDYVTISFYQQFNEVDYWTNQVKTKVGVASLSGKIKKIDGAAVYVIAGSYIKKIPFTSIVETQRAAYDEVFALSYIENLRVIAKAREQALSRLFRKPSFDYDSLISEAKQQKVEWFIKELEFIEKIRAELRSWGLLLFQDAPEKIKPFVSGKVVEMTSSSDGGETFTFKTLDYETVYDGYISLFLASPEQAPSWIIDKFDTFIKPSFCIRNAGKMLVISNALTTWELDDFAGQNDSRRFRELQTKQKLWKELNSEIEKLVNKIKELEQESNLETLINSLKINDRR